MPNPCGCVAGSFLCPEAVALWEAVNAAHRSDQTDRYEAALADYHAHMHRIWKATR